MYKYSKNYFYLKGIKNQQPKSTKNRYFFEQILMTIFEHPTPWGKFPLPKNFHQSFEKLVSGITSENGFSDDLNNAIQTFSVKANELIVARSGQYPHYDYTRADVDDLIALLKEVYLKAGGREEEFLPTDEDSPIPFSGDNFVRSIEANAEILNTTD